MRRARVRAKIIGTATIPRLSVFRGLKNMRLQLIDDVSHKTLATVTHHELSKNRAKRTKTAMAKALGVLLGEKAKNLGIQRVVFDRGPNQYHGRVAAAADGAREAGLQF